MFQKIILNSGVRFAALSATAILCITLPASAQTTEFKKQGGGYYKDVYDQNIHGEAVNPLDIGRTIRKITNNPVRSANVNIYDEVPDSAFFTNRHARSPLSAAQIEKGYAENEGPDLTGDLMAEYGKTDGLHPSYLVRDSRGDKYLLKFDSAENFELATSAEIIGSRIFYALGYNVPQYTLIYFPAGKIKADGDAKLRDETGFEKELTQAKLDESLLFAPQAADGSYRAVAYKLLNGEEKGGFNFTARRKGDPNDPVHHRDRREIRALRIFASWINNTDVREGNTVDIVEQANGEAVLKHYINDFNSSLGSEHHGAKPPSFGHEYFSDLGEITKAFLSFGFWEKPWQRRWREAGEKTNDSPAIGYFDNREFNPGKFKTQLPYETFKRLTRADAFWAAKQIMAFKDEDIRAAVSAGKVTAPEDNGYLTKTLIERRDMIGRHWFSQSAPLDDFQVNGGKLTFKDLAVEHGFEKADRAYYVTFLNAKGKAGQKAAFSGPSVDLNGASAVEIRTSENGPYVRVGIADGRIISIVHQD